MAENNPTLTSPKLFEELAKEWRTAVFGINDGLTTEPNHSLLTQVYGLVWWSTAYRVTSEARMRSIRAGAAEMTVVDQLLEVAAVSMIAIDLRRILEQGKLAGDWGVYSLRTVLKDMKKHRALLTRQNLTWLMSSPQITSKSATVSVVERAQKEDDEHIQLHIDRLCGVSGKRCPGDRIAEQFFHSIENELDKLDPVVAFVNKLVAHASTEASRNSAQGGYNIKMEQIWNALETVSRCTADVCRLLSPNSQYFMLLSAQEMFSMLDAPFIESGTEMSKRWEEYEDQIRKWSSGLQCGAGCASA